MFTLVDREHILSSLKLACMRLFQFQGRVGALILDMRCAYNLDYTCAYCLKVWTMFSFECKCLSLKSVHAIAVKTDLKKSKHGEQKQKI